MTDLPFPFLSFPSLLLMPFKTLSLKEETGCLSSLFKCLLPVFIVIHMSFPKKLFWLSFSRERRNFLFSCGSYLKKFLIFLFLRGLRGENQYDFKLFLKFSETEKIIESHRLASLFINFPPVHVPDSDCLHLQ